jgi:hypothetical protein
MSMPVPAPVYFASMPASVPMAAPLVHAAPPVHAVPRARDQQLGRKIKAAALMAGLAVTATLPAAQQALRFVFGEGEVAAGAAPVGFPIKTLLATALALFVAALVLQRDV